MTNPFESSDAATRVTARREPEIEQALAPLPPSALLAIADADPRRCPEAGVGKLHDLRTDADGIRRCWNCRRIAISPDTVGGYR